MRKIIYTVFIVIIILVVAAFIGYTRLPSFISSTLSKKAKVAVSIQKIVFDTKNIQVSDLNVSNPEGSTLPTALTVDTINVDAPITNYFHDNIVIDQITLDTVYLSLEFYKPKSTTGNWTYIIANLNENTGQKKENSTEILIKKLRLNNVEIDMYTHNSGTGVKRLKPIKKMEFTNITSSGGIPSAQIMNVVMQQALREIFSIQNLGNMLKDALTPQNTPGNMLNTFKGLFSDNTEEAASDAE